MKVLLRDLTEDVKWFGESVACSITEISEIISASLLVSSTILLENLTEDSIRNELSNRTEIRGKDVYYVLIQDFTAQNDFTEVSLAALNEEMMQVGTVKMRTYGNSTVKLKQKIKI